MIPLILTLAAVAFPLVLIGIHRAAQTFHGAKRTFGRLP